MQGREKTEGKREMGEEKHVRRGENRKKREGKRDERGKLCKETRKWKEREK